MNDSRPTRGREETPGGRHSKRNPRCGCHALELRERLAAILAELRRLDADHVDVPLTLVEGLLEDVEAA